ncbi:YdcF family protein [Azospirillum sp. sgz301742]
MNRAFRQQSGVARAFKRLALLALLLGAVWAGGLVWFIRSIPREPPAAGNLEALQPTDAIVVLTGGSGRLSAGLELLKAGVAKKLFVSGVYESVDVKELLRLSQLSPDRVECCVVLGYAAADTVGNAFETADWMEEQGYRSLRLVTANYHMRRSLLEFAIAAPDIAVVPHAVAPANVHLADWWLWPGTANLLVNEYDKYLVALLRYQLEKALDS